MIKQDKNYYLYADIIRSVATVQVVILHAVAPLLYLFNKIDPVYWWIGNVIDSAMRTCVPLFLMLSGLLLLDKSEKTTNFFKKRFLKVLLPFLLWWLIFFFLRFKGAVVSDLREFITGPYFFHFWFIYVLLGLYLVSPLLKFVINRASAKHLQIFLILWFIFACATAYLPIRSALIDFVQYCGYFILGYYLKSVSLTKKQISTYIFIFALSFVITAIGTFVVTSNKGIFDNLFYKYLSPNIILMSVALFLILKSMTYEKIRPIWAHKIQGFASASFGIYIIHPFFIYQLNTNIPILASSVLGIPLIIISTLFFSFLLIYLLKKSAILRILAP